MFWISKIGIIYLQDDKEFSSFPALNNLQEILGSRAQYPSLFLASVVENAVLWCHWHSRVAEVDSFRTGLRSHGGDASEAYRPELRAVNKQLPQTVWILKTNIRSSSPSSTHTHSKHTSIFTHSHTHICIFISLTSAMFLWSLNSVQTMILSSQVGPFVIYICVAPWKMGTWVPSFFNYLEFLLHFLPWQSGSLKYELTILSLPSVQLILAKF